VSNGPVWHEPPKLASGVAIWSFGRFDVAPGNTPLGRGLAALPVLAVQPELDPAALDRQHQDRDELSSFIVLCRWLWRRSRVQ